MNNIATSFKQLGDLINDSQRHGLSSQQIEALNTAKNALLVMELLGISIHADDTLVT